MEYSDNCGPLPALYTSNLDLNDLLLDHPAACFIFQLGNDLAIVDRAAKPDDRCMVVIDHFDGRFTVEPYHQQRFFGVITYRIFRTL